VVAVSLVRVTFLCAHPSPEIDSEQPRLFAGDCSAGCFVGACATSFCDCDSMDVFGPAGRCWFQVGVVRVVFIILVVNGMGPLDGLQGQHGRAGE
jgi:hypothetical protein